jgi:hypothetical protein
MASERDAHHLRQALDTWLARALGTFSQAFQEVGA